ncbi:MAG: ATP-grasp domain-containing protein [Candidatus Pacebacteria bacterium]|nr:ATP-grasp domain-containing protein [Candidatus Paceibacterota bacterium]
MRPLRIAVLRGGNIHTHNLSLETGRRVLSALHRHHVQPHDVIISYEHADDDFHASVMEPLVHDTDIVFNALHEGHHHEHDILHTLASLPVPFTGSHTHPVFISSHHHTTNDFLKLHDVKTPTSIFIRNQDPEQAYDTASQVHATISPPWLIKPTKKGVTGIRIAHSFQELVHAIESSFRDGQDIVVQELLRGKHISVIVIENLREQEHYTCIPVETCEPYSDKETRLCPASISLEESKQVQQIAEKIHRLFHLRHYSQIDMIVHPKRGIIITGVHALPDLTVGSILDHSLTAVGVKFHDFIWHIVQLATKRNI